MNVGQQFAGAVFVDFLKFNDEEVVIDDHGNGHFKVNEKNVSCWIIKD